MVWFRASGVPLLVTDPLRGNDHYNQLVRENGLLAALGKMGRINVSAAIWTGFAAALSAIAACLGRSKPTSISLGARRSVHAQF